MKNLIIAFLVASFSIAHAQDATLKSISLKQLKDSHTDKNWFVPVNEALQSMTAKQAMWTDGSGNHSVGQLAHHLFFWNERMLRNFKGEDVEKFNGNNDETFDQFDEKQWEAVVAGLDKVMSDLEALVQNASEEQVMKWTPTLINIGAHNAYHTGQIVFVRKLQGSWKSEYGVN